MSAKTIYVYESRSSAAPVPMGRIYLETPRGKEICSFEYEPAWLTAHPGKAFLDPELHFCRGRQYVPMDKGLFGTFADSCPDRWGRLLMRRHEAILAHLEGRKPRQLQGSDLLLGVHDETRMGALRFALQPGGPFLSAESSTAVPTWAMLRELEKASLAFERDEDTLNDRWLRLLLAPGSSLGGARPKANVRDAEGSLWIAKFPSRNDEQNVGAWEQVAHELAKACGIRAAESRLERFSDAGSTYLVKRFDRHGTQRIHFSSAMALLGKTDGASAADGSSYLELAEFITAYGAAPEADLPELWRRIVFSMAVSNTDDHLRNHGFLLDRQGWVLSPIFDVNPVPYGKALALNVSPDDNRIDIGLAIEVAPFFGLDRDEAAGKAKDMLSAVGRLWQPIAEKCGLNRHAQNEMAPAFSLCRHAI